MVVIFPKGGFSNFLEQKNLRRGDKRQGYLEHEDYIANALQAMENERALLELLEFYKLEKESISFVIKEESSDAFYYLRFVEDSAISVIFGKDALEVLEILIDPKKTLPQNKDGGEESRVYLKIIAELTSNLRIKPSIQKMIEESKESDIYFIDTYEAERRHVYHTLGLWQKALQAIDPKISYFVFNNKSSYFMVQYKHEGEMPQKPQAKDRKEDFKNIESRISIESEKEKTLYILYKYGIAQYIIEIKDMQSDVYKQEAIGIICNILLNALNY